MEYLGKIIAGIGLAWGAFFGHHDPQVANTPLFGAYSPTGGGTYRLGQSVGTADSSIKLSSFTEPVSGIKYTMSYLNSDIEYGTLAPQSSISEFISFTGITQNTDGSALLTGVTRGLSRTPAGAGCVASTTLAQPHPAQSIFIVSDSPCFFAEYLPLRTNSTSTAIVTFSSSTPPRYDLDNGSMWSTATGTTFVDLYKLNSTAFGGGVVSVGSGGTGNTAPAPGLVLVTNAAGTQILGSSTPTVAAITATSTSQASQLPFASTTVITATTASTTNLVVSSGGGASTRCAQLSTNGTLSAATSACAGVGANLLATSTTSLNPSNASTTIFSITVPGGTLSTGNMIHVRLVRSLYSVVTASNIIVDVGYGTASTTLTLTNGTGSTINANGYTDFYLYATGTTNAQYGYIEAFAVGTGITTSPAAFNGITSQVLAIDSTQSQKLIMVIKSNNASSNFTVDNWYAEVLR